MELDLSFTFLITSSHGWRGYRLDLDYFNELLLLESASDNNSSWIYTVNNSLQLALSLL
jgi:hypothetical protein